eukprot:4907579-Amphidinium_carterae.1
MGTQSDVKIELQLEPINLGCIAILSGVGQWSLWVVAGFMLAMPGATYALVKTVPGFMPASSWTVVLGHVVALFAALMTSLCLPRCAALLVKRWQVTWIKEDELLAVGKILVTPLVPGLLTVVLDERCLRGWVTFWEPCRGSQLEVTAGRQLDWMGRHLTFSHAILSRKSLCGMPTVSRPSSCVHAVLDRSAVLFLGSLSHMAFTTPALLLLRGKLIKLSAFRVTLAFTWELAIMLVPFIPLACPLLLMLSAVHQTLLSAGLLVNEEGSLTFILPTAALKV